jgi:serine/threonine-protein kinase
VFSAPDSSTGALRFGRYEVLFRIAAGGMAEVYAARMVGEGGFEKPVALKRMLPTLAEDERFVEMFLDEGKLAAHISSPHVVQTLDLGRAEDDSLYLVMELVVGVSLAALVRAVLRSKSQLSPAVAVEILSQAAAGLHDAHEARTMYGQPLEIVHRDISPQNILVDVAGRVRITDFGVARALERATHTQSGEVKGKIGYFAPEQVRGKNVDRRTDIFAMGICAWETIAGKRLFQGDNPAQTLDMVMSMPVPRLDALRPDVPSEVADAIAKALERDQAARFQTSGEFAETLRYAMRPAGAKGVAELVRSHGGESLMKLEEGLRVRSPSTASRVRRADLRESGEATSPSRAGRTSIPQPPAPPTSQADQAATQITDTASLGAPSPFGLAPPQEIAVDVQFDRPASPAPSPMRWALIGAGTLAVISALGGIGWAATSSGGDEVTSTPLTAAAPSPTAGTAIEAQPATAPQPTIEPQAATAQPAQQPAIAQPAIAQPAIAQPTTAPTSASPAPSEPNRPRVATTMQPETVTDMQPEVSVTRPAIEPQTDMRPVVEAVPDMRPTVSETATMEAPTEMATSTMMNGLAGFEDFEDELE